MTKIDNNHFTVEWTNDHDLQSGVEYTSDTSRGDPFLMNMAPGKQIADCVGETTKNGINFNCDLSGDGVIVPHATVRFTTNVSYDFYRMHVEGSGPAFEIISEDPDYSILYNGETLAGF